MLLKRAVEISLIFILPLICFIFFAGEPVEAALKPEEIVVLVNSESPDSIRIGKLYIELRKAPLGHLIKVKVPITDHVSRKDYEELIAGPVRRAVKEHYDRGKKIRCIVTTYGIPLRIGPAKPLIVPVEEIDKNAGMIKRKEEKLSDLKKKRKESKAPDKDLKKEIYRLKNEINKLKLKLANLKGADTVAAVDSEIALLLMPDYQLAGWQPNPQYIYNRVRKIFYFGQVLMVSRLDAPTPELAEGLIRTAVEVEKTGLSGNIYLDARGLTGKGDFALFDEDIRRTAQILKRGSMHVILDDRSKLFGPGDAPSAALYCGWYSLGKYRDAFEWSRGAVGYHVASAEAVSIHNPNARYWVKRMIEKGVIATLGPVAEPYLNAFPSPSVFFPLLMSGEYTLVEVFAMTNPVLSWRMILVGDPLYNPFKNHPAFVLKNPTSPPK